MYNIISSWPKSSDIYCQTFKNVFSLNIAPFNLFFPCSCISFSLQTAYCLIPIYTLGYYGYLLPLCLFEAKLYLFAFSPITVLLSNIYLVERCSSGLPVTCRSLVIFIAFSSWLNLIFAADLHISVLWNEFLWDLLVFDSVISVDSVFSTILLLPLIRSQLF